MRKSKREIMAPPSAPSDHWLRRQNLTCSLPLSVLWRWFGFGSEKLILGRELAGQKQVEKCLIAAQQKDRRADDTTPARRSR